MNEIAGFTVHPAAELFPMMSESEYEGLVSDIRTNGLAEPVEVDVDGRLIDGRNRVRACEQLGVEVRTKTYPGDNVVQRVTSMNLHRRNLNDAQRAMIAARIATRLPGYRNEIADKSTPSGEGVPPTVSEAASLLAVVEDAVTKAKAIERSGTESLKNLVTDGKAPLATAARVARDLTDEEQDAFVERVRSGVPARQAAPPDTKQKERRDRATSTENKPAAPRAGANKRKHREQIDAAVVALEGVVAAFSDVTELDASITSEEATRLMGDLSRQIRLLGRINSLLKERTA